ncbi:serine/threonine protein kinase [Streptomyces armeniacus]|uniref:Serine/threonine protein kinase n=1 Tax=Streptomyces armeniacus TaxID=83291 RepID=A0A345XU47_9ACTN|nr:serine/threonine-protein kinase [Streptomyces armeniacus]AXK35163.1 serine/threonine protein kinase [Streptomyces armeniacus]
MVDPLGPGDPAEVSGYALAGRLGEGGMGSVYLSHTRGGQPVALKVIRREFAQNPEFLRRFTREVEAARRVQGAYTAAVVDSSTEGPLPWLASAYVPGPSLARAVDEHGPLPLRTVLLLIAGVAEALQSVHATGIVHRDLKPSNVLMAADGPRVIDFGIARAVDATALTGTDVRLGTPAFMSPEQVSGEAAGPPLDVFALGLTAFFAATGKHPFGEGDPQALLYRITSMEPVMTACPEELRSLLHHCMAKDPAKRPGLAEIIEDCRRIADAAGTSLVRSEGWWLPSPVADDVKQRTADPRIPAPVGSYDPTVLDGHPGRPGAARAGGGQTAPGDPNAPQPAPLQALSEFRALSWKQRFGRMLAVLMDPRHRGKVKATSWFVAVASVVVGGLGIAGVLPE